MEQRDGPAVAAAGPPNAGSTDDIETDTPPATPRILGSSALTPRAMPVQRAESSFSDSPPHKKFKGTPAKTPRPGRPETEPETPVLFTGKHEQMYSRSQDDEIGWYDEDMKLPKTPVPAVERQRSVSSSPSDVSLSSRGRAGSTSPVTPFVPEVPPAPPSTPASEFKSTISESLFEGLSTPLPYEAPVRNAAQLEQQQLLADGAVTPAPTKPASNRTAPHQASKSLIDDFTDWAVGDRYKLVRMLGRGSYGEVAQAFDLHDNNASVAIKRIQSPFDQEVDAVRLFREIHILRRLKGHSCVIDLLDVIQPPTNDLDDFNDLYLVFECKFRKSGERCCE